MEDANAYYAVIFTSRHSGADKAGYDAMAKRMAELASQQPGFLGMESARNSEDGLGITVSYWQDEESIREWKRQSEHLVAQKLGREQWYTSFRVRVAKVCREYHHTNQ